MLKALALLFLLGLGTAPAPTIHAVSLPRHAVKGTLEELAVDEVKD